MAYIEFKNVEVRFTDFVAGLRGVNLSIERGEFAFIVGRTGAGKSTLLKLLTKEVRPTSGEVWLDGRELGKMPPAAIPMLRREMGIVPQDFALLPKKRVWENVGYALRAVGATRKQVRSQVPEILDRVNILHRADAFPAELSGGEQQRVAIARALINNPNLLVADEPTGNLDPEQSWEIIELLKHLNLRGTTVLIATHDMMVVERAKGRIIRMESGLVASDSKPVPEVVAEGLFATPETEEPDA
ncbi:MAG TPA: ATP-binding cassette domain-containing protein [Fimbriimonadaceae bacterium]|nr:ATP-binding cassette domain-containing protein [Fimbriimonadaceae bacterium]